MRLPIIVLACKADLQPQVEPEYTSKLLQPYRAGLVEVTVNSDVGKDKLKRSFDWLLKAVFRHRSLSFLRYALSHTQQSSTEAIDTINVPDHTYLNPASPDVLVSPPPWESSRTATPTMAQPHPPPLQPPPPPPSHHHQPQTQSYYTHPPEKSTPVTAFPIASVNARNEDDEALENHLVRIRSVGENILSSDDIIHQPPSGNEFEDDEPIDPMLEASRQQSGKEKDKPCAYLHNVSGTRLLILT